MICLTPEDAQKTPSMQWSCSGETFAGDNRKNIPLSFAQERLWFLQQLTPENIFCKFEVLQLVGALDIQALEQAFQTLIRRHESLRIRFTQEHGKVQQVITAPHQLNFQLRVEDVRFLDERHLDEFFLQEQSKQFDLFTAPLWRVRLLRLADHYRLVVAMHSIIADEDSWDIFMQELSILYKAYLNNKENPLPALSLQYGDFVDWQRNCCSDQALETDLNYWKQKLSDCAELQFPTDFPRPTVQSFSGKTLDFSIPTEISHEFRKIAEEQKVSLFAVFLSAFNVLLARYTGQEEIVIGTQILDRHNKALEGVMGAFVNNLVLPSNLAGEPSFLEVVNRSHAMLNEVYSHRAVPFQSLVKHLHIKTDWSRTPLFQVAFIWKKKRQDKLNLEGLTTARLPSKHGYSYFDLSMILCEKNGEITGVIEYNTDIIEPATAERISKNFQVLLASIVKNPHDAVVRLPILSVDETERLLVEINNTFCNYESSKTIHQLFYEQVVLTPNNPCLVYDNTSLTYKELNQRANLLAHELIKNNVKVNALVALCISPGLEMIIGMLGILKAGAAYVPIDPEYPPGRIKSILMDADANVLLTKKNIASMFDNFQGKIIPLDDWVEIEEEYADTCPDVQTTSENLAYVIYTSSSEGRPKGVCCIHRNVINLLGDLREKELLPNESWTLLTSMSFDASVHEILSAILTGCCLHIVPENARTNHEKLFTYLSVNKINNSYLPPYMIANFANWLQRNPNAISLKKIHVGVESINEKLLIFIAKNIPDVKIINGYGPTETTVFSTTYSVISHSKDKNLRKNTPIGKPIRNTKIYILDKYLQLIPQGAIGELYIGGAGVAKGYLKLPQLTAERFINNPYGNSKLYKTGDLVRMMNDGNLEFIGRRDEQIKIRGLRIELGEIANCLNELKIIRDCYVLINHDQMGKKRIEAYVVRNEQYQPTPILNSWNIEDEKQFFFLLKNYLRGRLPKYMIPTHFHLIDKLPVTTNGKIAKDFFSSIDKKISKVDFVSPKTKIEIVVVNIFRSVLDVDCINVNDDIFEIGASSLHIIEIIARVNQLFNLDLKISLLFDLHIISEFISELTRNLAKKEFLLGKIQNKLMVTTIRGKGEKSSLFVIKAEGGEKFCYDSLAKYLGNERPVYCIAPRKNDLFSEDSVDLKRIANYYMHFILKIQPQSHYLLCGALLGGTIAIEVARLLQQHGKRVGIVALFDTAGISPGNSIDQLALFKPIESISDEGSEPSCDMNFWKNSSSQALDIYLVPGNRETFLAEPNVSILAKGLKACLDKADIREYQLVTSRHLSLNYPYQSTEILCQT